MAVRVPSFRKIGRSTAARWENPAIRLDLRRLLSLARESARLVSATESWKLQECAGFSLNYNKMKIFRITIEDWNFQKCTLFCHFSLRHFLLYGVDRFGTWAAHALIEELNYQWIISLGKLQFHNLRKRIFLREKEKQKSRIDVTKTREEIRQFRSDNTRKSRGGIAWRKGEKELDGTERSRSADDAFHLRKGHRTVIRSQCFNVRAYR